MRRILRAMGFAAVLLLFVSPLHSEESLDPEAPPPGIIIEVPNAGEMMALDPNEWRGIRAERDAAGRTKVGCDHATSEHDGEETP